MGSATQDDLLYLSSKFSKTLKSKFGKGPETCYVVFKENRLFIYISSFMTSAEEVLVENDQVNLANKFRTAVIDLICKEFLPEASKVMDLSFHTFYHDWNYDTNKGIIIIEPRHIRSGVSNDFFFREKDLFKLMEQVCTKVHKVPEEYKIVKCNQNVCIVECKGVLLSMDRYLFQQGLTDILVEHSREMKSYYLNRKDQFENVFNRVIDDLFITWDYEQDKNFIVFNFR
ncbi:MAG: Na-translocating system protein MpsC family protein [Bacillota bacterium]